MTEASLPPGDDPDESGLERTAGVSGAGGDEPGGFQLPDLQDLLAQAQQVQEQLVAAQAEAADQVFTGRAGGGVVRIELSGSMEVRAVHIDPEVVDPDEVELLEDLVLAALRDAESQVSAAQQASLGGLGLGGLLGG